MNTEQHEALAARVEAGLIEMFVRADALESRPQASGFRRVWVLTPKGVEPHILATLGVGVETAHLNLVALNPSGWKETVIGVEFQADYPGAVRSLAEAINQDTAKWGHNWGRTKRDALRNSLRPECEAGQVFVKRFGAGLPANAPQPAPPTAAGRPFEVLEVTRKGGRVTMTVDGKVVHAGPAGSADHIVVNTDLRQLEVSPLTYPPRRAGESDAEYTDRLMNSPPTVFAVPQPEKPRGTRIMVVDQSLAGIRDEIVSAMEGYTHGDSLPGAVTAGAISNDEHAFIMGVVEYAQENRSVVVPDLGVPSTMGHLRAMGSRPLVTVEDGPRYDFDEVP